MRTGRYREARVEGWAALVVRRLVGARAQTVGISIDLPDQVRGTLEAFGLRAVRDAVACTVATLPEQLRRSLTWDRGRR